MDLRQTVNSNTNDLSAFFWENAKKDLCIIGKTSSRGEDEVAMLLHVVIHNIYQMDATGNGLHAEKKLTMLHSNPLSNE